MVIKLLVPRTERNLEGKGEGEKGSSTTKPFAVDYVTSNADWCVCVCVKGSEIPYTCALYKLICV